MADNIARTIAALRPYAIPVAVVLRAHYQSVNPEDILALCDAAERGLRVPPREPTQAMMDAARDYMPMGIWPGSLLIRGLWRAMYDASPINEGGQDAAVGNDADARDAVAPSPPVPPSPAAPFIPPMSQCLACGGWYATTVGHDCDSASIPPAPAAPAPDHSFSTAGEPAQQEQHDDNESDGRRTCGVACEGNQGQLPTGGGNGPGGCDRSGEHGAGILRPQQSADPCRGNATRLLIDNETLRRQIAADPDDEPSAGTAAPAPGLRDKIMDAMSPMSRHHALWSNWPGTCVFADAALSVVQPLLDAQAEQIARLTRERDEARAQIEAHKIRPRGKSDSPAIFNAVQRAENAEAECERLRTVIAAVRGLYQVTHIHAAIDAARGEGKK